MRAFTKVILWLNEFTVDQAGYKALWESFFGSIRIKQVDGVRTISTGPFEVYACTHESCLEEVELNNTQTYPVKIGYVQTVGCSKRRIDSQLLGSDEYAC